MTGYGMSEKGEIKVTQLPKFEVEWKVKDFSTIRDKNAFGISSPEFQAGGSRFRIWLDTACVPCENEDYISLRLSKYLAGQIPQSVTFSMKVGNTWIATKKCEKREAICTFINYTSDRFVKISELETISEYNTSINSNTAKPAIAAANQYSFTIVCLISYVDSFEQSDVSTQTANSNDIVQTLSNDLKELYINKEHCDVKIKVGFKEFSAHKVILSARSPVFASMFRHEMAENVNGTLDISDCDPESFELFLKFLYTGKMHGVCYSNAISLYKTADKYSVGDLKEECVVRLWESMETEHICDILELAAAHEEKKLLETAINFFAENVKYIFVTAKWQKFLIENLTLANECLIKMAEKKF